MSFWSPFTQASKKAEGAPPPAPTQQMQSQGNNSKPIPVGHVSPAHNHHEGATDLDLYRTFSPSDVGMWSWQPTTGDSPGGRASIWGKLFSANSNK